MFPVMNSMNMICVLTPEILDLQINTCYHLVYGWTKIPVCHFVGILVKPSEV